MGTEMSSYHYLLETLRENLMGLVSAEDTA